MEQKTKVERKKGASARLPGHLLSRVFFEDAPEKVAPRLLGKLLVHKTAQGPIAGRIVEVEAYLGPHNNPPDPAAHSHRGPTPRNQVLFGPAGHAYIYSIYGLYFCMNFSCESDGLGGGILVRALQPVLGQDLMAANRNLPPASALPLLTSGPGRLSQALALTRTEHNGLDVTSAASPLQARDDGFVISEALVTIRIGITHAIERPLRFAIPDNAFVSGPKSLRGLLQSL